MKTLTLFCLALSLLMFGCSRQSKPGAFEPKPIFEEEKDSEEYIMLEDEDVGISRDNNSTSGESETSTASNP